MTERLPLPSCEYLISRAIGGFSYITSCIWVWFRSYTILAVVEICVEDFEKKKKVLAFLAQHFTEIVAMVS